MKNESLTLFIPLYGKAMMSREGFLHDPTAEKIVSEADFDFAKVDRSRKLAIYMAMRAALYDGYVREFARQHPDGLILQLGVGLDSRVRRVPVGNAWYDLDLPEVIDLRKAYFPADDRYRLIGAPALPASWLADVPKARHALVLAEGLSMYLQMQELHTLLRDLKDRFGHVHLLMDSYTTFGAAATKYKNPINTVGVTRVYGFDDPREPAGDTGFRFVAEHGLTPDSMIAELPKAEQRFFKNLFAGKLAKKIYRLYEYEA